VWRIIRHMVGKVIIFNGPPNSGKDTAVAYIEQCFGATHVRFKDALVNLCCATYKTSPDWWRDHYTRELKDIKQPELLNQSPREALIHISENVIKVFFGDDVFGRITAQSLAPDALTVISDGGFVSELKPIIDTVGSNNVIIVRLHRHGCDFSRDSRAYLPDGVLGCMVYDLENQSDVPAFLAAVHALAQTHITPRRKGVIFH
jgi:hypothetical protein